MEILFDVLILIIVALSYIHARTFYDISPNLIIYKLETDINKNNIKELAGFSQPICFNFLLSDASAIQIFKKTNNAVDLTRQIDFLKPDFSIYASHLLKEHNNNNMHTVTSYREIIYVFDGLLNIDIYLPNNTLRNVNIIVEANNGIMIPAHWNYRINSNNKCFFLLSSYHTVISAFILEFKNVTNKCYKYLML
jgi:hypothetical protein